MIATVINAALILAGSLLGLLFKNRISQRFSTIVTQALGLCVMGIGVSSIVGGDDTLCVIVCMVIGTLLGEALRIEDRLDSMGELLRTRLVKGDGGTSRFTEGFVTASILYCVGSMAVMGAMEAGINHNYSILISKGVIDGVTSITFAAAMGVGVACSVVPLVIYQGILTIAFAAAGQGMDPVAVTGMSAVGGTIILGIGINMLGLAPAKLRVGNMLPAIFLPLLYLPLTQWLGTLLP
jgi:hypothetical protein